MGELKMLNMDQTQRRDIDTTLDDRLTLAIDEENIADNPYIFEPTSFVGNNWFKQGNNIVKLNLAEQDSLIFLSSPLTKLGQKDISNVIVSFDYNISNVSVNYPILSNISLTCMEMTNYMLVENILTTQGHIDVDCSLFNFSSNVVNTSISEQGFKVGINFNGNKSNATIKLSNVQIQFKYNNKLLQQSDSVVNRLEPYVDFYRDEDGDLVLQIGGDASGKGMDHSGGDIDTYSKTEIDNKLATKVNVEVGKGLSSNDYTLTEKTKLGTVETNANYYVHPSSHQTGMIVETSALSNLETSANATQHEINLAIDDKINQGGGGSGGSYINDYYWDDETQDIILDYDSGVSEADIVTTWSSPLRDDRVPSEKLVKEYVDNSGGGSSVDIVTTWESTPSNSKVPSEKLVYDSIIGKIDDVSESGDVFYNDDSMNGHIYLFNSYLDFNVNNNSVKYNNSELATVSDIPSLANYVQKSNTNGLLKNDGSVDTTSYSTFDGDYNSLINKPTIPVIPTNISAFTNDVGYLTQHQSLTNYVQKSSTTGLLRNDGTVDTTSYATSSQISSMLTTSDVVDNLTSTSSTAPLSAKQGKALNDLIGQAITYINQ